MNFTKTNIIFSPVLIADDERGRIEKLDRDGKQSVLLITSKKGTVRANHYHKKDSHVSYLIKGKIRYVERAIDDETEPLNENIIEPGQCFYTSPMIAHAMEFLEDSEFIAISPRSGNQAEYENDIIRVTLIDPQTAASRTAT